MWILSTITSWLLLMIPVSSQQFPQWQDQEELESDLFLFHNPHQEIFIDDFDVEEEDPFDLRSEDLLNYRLPVAVKPRHYTIKLQPLLYGNFSIIGFVEILVEALVPTKNITLHIDDIITHNETTKVTEITPTKHSRNIKVIKQEYERKRNFYTIFLEEELEPEKTYIISLHYLAYLNKKLVGFYRSVYKDENNIERRVAGTQFEATEARKAFPCFDEPALKAGFTIHLARLRNMSTLSNMNIIATTPIANSSWVWDIYATSVEMSTYLVAFIVSDYDFRISTTSDVLFRVWTRPNAINDTEYARVVGPRLINHFEDYFGINYPIPKMDMVSVPQFRSAAMENWGLVLYKESALLFNEALHSLKSKQSVASVIAHELAHQWYGNLVSPDWWNNIWLNEGFATYYTILGLEQVEPSWKSMDMFVTKSVHQCLTIDSRDSSRPIYKDVSTPKQIRSMFDSITYQKGATVIRMMSHFLTEATMKRGLSNYLKEKKYKTAVQDELWMYLTNVAHQDNTLDESYTVKDIMDTWTLQSGYPLVTLERNNDGTAEITQEHFKKTDFSEDSAVPSNRTWWIPISWTSRENKNFASTTPQVWIPKGIYQTTLSGFPSKDHWVVMNIQQTGYYRVNYDMDNWEAIKQQLLVDHNVIHQLNRAQIVNDAFNLAFNGKLNYSVPMDIISYLSWEEEFVPIRTAYYALKVVLHTSKTQLIDRELLQHLQSIIGPKYRKLGLFNKETDADTLKLKRTLISIWACELQYRPCIEDVTAAFRSWLSNGRAGINDLLLLDSPTMYCEGIRYGSPEDWDAAFSKYLTSKLASERYYLIHGLGCSNHDWKLYEYLDEAAKSDGKIAPQHRRTAVTGLLSQSLGYYIVNDYIRKNTTDPIVKKAILKYIVQFVRTKSRLQEFSDLLNHMLSSEVIGQNKHDDLMSKVTMHVAKTSSVYEGIKEWLHYKRRQDDIIKVT